VFFIKTYTDNNHWMEVSPEHLFEPISGIDKGIVEKIVREFHLRTLEELEQAA
jgi:hypothetical protein